MRSEVSGAPSGEQDPRWTRIFPLPQAAAKPAFVRREVPTSTEPRAIRLKNRKAVVFPNIQMHPSNTTTQSEMTVTTHPLNPDIVLAGANAVHTAVTVGSQGWYYTTDGGAGWQGGDTLPTHTSLDLFMADPAVGINLDGQLFFNALLFGGTADVIIARSTDNGANWSQAVVPSPTSGEDKNHMAIDINPASLFEGYIYTGYTDFDFSPSPLMFSLSADRGVSFSAPVPISGSVGSDFAQGANLAVGPNGELYAAWSGYDSFPPVTTHLGFNQSTDGGINWQGAVSVRDIFDIRGQLNKGGNFVRVNSFPSMAVDRSNSPRNGWIYIVYAEKNPTIPDIFLIRSTDGGNFWSTPQKVNQDNSGKDQWFPWISVDPTTGHLYVVYYDSRNFPGNDSAQVYISSSTDGGGTFEDVLVSDMAFLPTPIPGLAGGYMGDYIGISALNGVVWPSWNDNRTGIHQAYTSRIVFVEVGSPPKISVSPDSLDFGEVFLGYPETLSVSIRNLGFPESLLVSNIVSDNPDFTPELTNFILPGGANRKVKIAFNPSSIGSAAATLTISSSDAVNPTVPIVLTGASVYPPALAVSPDSFAFTLNEGDSATALLTIADTGLGNLNWRISVAGVSGVASRLFTLPGGERAANPDWAAQENSSRPEGGAATVPLSSLQALLTDLTGKRIGISDPFGIYTIIRADLEARGAVVVNVTFPLGPGALDSLNVLAVDDGIFDAAAGDIDAIRTWLSGGRGLLVQGDEALININTLLSGTGLNGNFTSFSFALLTNILPHPTTQGVASINAQSYGAYYMVAAPAQPIVIDELSRPHAAVSTLGGGRVLAVGNEVCYDIDINVGDTRLFCNQVFDWLGGTSNFLTLTPDSGSLAAGESTQVEVKVKTDQLDGGTFRANLLVSSNDPAHPEDTVPLRLTVIGTPNLVLSDDTLDFGEAFIGYPDTLVLRITNNGSDVLEVSGMSVDNARFTVLDAGVFSLPQNQYRDVAVAFLPIQPGAEAGLLSITSNDPGDLVVSVQLLGTGIHPPVIDVTPDSLAFTLDEGDSAKANLFIANTGLGVLAFQVETGFGPGLQTAAEPFAGQPLRNFPMSIESKPFEWKSGPFGESIRSSGQVPQGSAAAHQSLPLPLVVRDSVGDGGVVDIREIRGRSTASSVGLQLVFATPLNPANFGGYLGLDLDQNTITGIPLPFGMVGQDVGCEYVVGFFALAGNVVNLFTSGGGLVGNFPAVIDSVGFSFDLPLSALNFDDGRLNLAAVLGDNFGPTDWIPDLGHGVLQFDWLSVTPSDGAVPPGESLEVEVRVKSDNLPAGTFRANVLISSNDPVHPVNTVPVSLTVITCTADKGDLNGDSFLTIADAVLEINCVFLGVGNGTVGGDCNFCYTDLNCDGALGPADVVLELLRVFLFRPLPC